jgi:hypothetical protein
LREGGERQRHMEEEEEREKRIKAFQLFYY